MRIGSQNHWDIWKAKTYRSWQSWGLMKKNHEVVTGYFDCTFSDKACMAANIQADALFDSVLANADKIVQQADNMNDDNDDDGI